MTIFTNAEHHPARTGNKHHHAHPYGQRATHNSVQSFHNAQKDTTRLTFQQQGRPEQIETACHTQCAPTLDYDLSCRASPCAASPYRLSSLARRAPIWIL
jgi:hypothetical protein